MMRHTVYDQCMCKGCGRGRVRVSKRPTKLSNQMSFCMDHLRSITETWHLSSFGFVLHYFVKRSDFVVVSSLSANDCSKGPEKWWLQDHKMYWPLIVWTSWRLCVEHESQDDK